MASICNGDFSGNEDAIVHGEVVQKYLQAKRKADWRYMSMKKGIFDRRRKINEDTSGAGKVSSIAKIQGAKIHCSSKETKIG